MYTSYFGLTEKPFTITPDPRYLYMSTRHGEALAHLIYGVTESDGFIQLTGEVGTGKTTLIRSLLQQLPDQTDIALVLNPQLSAPEFLSVICKELHVPGSSDETSLKILIDRLNEHLLEAHAAGRRTILVVDEAQNLAAEVLEQVRLLTNLETTRQKLLQIILIGQPELRDLLGRNDLRQLAQRVTARYHLEPLSRDEAQRYIDHRLEIAGAVGEIFTDRAKKEVYRLSHGVPRLMNVICDRALLGAYVREQKQVDHKLVRQAAAEIAGRTLQGSLDRYLVPLLGVAGALMVVAGIWSFSRSTTQASATPATPDASLTEAASGSDAGVPGTESLAAGGSRSADAAPVRREPVEPSLAAVLHENQNATGTETAFTTLFAMWDTPYEIGAGGSCEQAVAHGLKCLFLRGSWNIVRQLDRPAILTLTDRDGEAHHVVLARLGEQTAELAIGPRRVTLPLNDVSEYWFGESLLLWNPPGGVAKAYRRGMRDPGVLWLRQSLAAIQGLPVQNPNSDLFDEALERQVRDYQRGRRLKVDGLVGQQTQIIINSDLGLEGIPRLSQETS